MTGGDLETDLRVHGRVVHAIGREEQRRRAHAAAGARIRRDERRDRASRDQREGAHRRFAARSVFSRRHAIVMGPTPPGTGVMWAARVFASSKATSPTSLPSTRLMPTSRTIAPSFTQSP